jgi:5'-nucleotidase
MELKLVFSGIGIELDGLVDKKCTKKLSITTVETAQEMTRILKEENKCDLIICLSHLGYNYKMTTRICDLTSRAATKDIDLIIGGHTYIP